MIISLQRYTRLLLLAAGTAFAAACSDSATAPITPAPEGLSGTLSFGDSVFTRGSVVRASFAPPAGFNLVPGSVKWTVATGAATVLPVAGTNQADVTFTAAGAAQISATYSITRDAVSSSLSAAAPTLRSSGVASSTASRSVTVSAPTLAFAVRPTATAAASTTLGGVRVELRDARGRAIAGVSDSVNIRLDPTSGTTGAALTGTATAAAVSGVASFNNLAIRRSGTGYRLIASSAGIAKTDTALVAITPGAPSAAGSTLALSRTALAAGDTLTVSVTVRDEYGNIVTDVTPAALAGVTSGGAVGAFTCRTGICTATYTAPLLAGTPTVGVTIGGANVGGSPATVTVNAGAPARFVIVGASSQVAGTAQTITIRAIDAFGNIAAGYTGAKALSFSGALVAPIGTNPTVSGTPFGTGATITFVNGIATASVTLVGAGPNVVTATDGAVTTSGADRLGVAVVHNAADVAQTVVTLSPSSVTPGGTVTVTVTLRDAWGNPVLNATPALLTGTPGAGTLGAFTCTNGVCTASYVAPNTAGPYPLPFTINGQPLPPATVTVVAGVPTRLVITGSTTQFAGTTQTMTVRALDAAGNVVSGYTGLKSLQFSGASVSPSGTQPDAGGIRFGVATSATFTNGVATLPLRLFAAETATIATTDGTVSSVGVDRLSVVVSAAAAARLTVQGASTQPAGSAQSMLIVASDTWGNRALSYSGSKSLTFSGATAGGGSNVPKVGTTPFGTATPVLFALGAAANVPLTLFVVETAQIAATDGVISATGASRLTVAVTAGAVSASTSTLAVSASSLTPGQQITVTVTLRDAAGNIVQSASTASFAGTVTGGVLGSWLCTNGVCTAPYTAPLLAGGQSIAAKIGGTDVLNSPAAVTVAPGPASRFVITGSGSQTAGASQTIAIRALDANGNIATGYTGAKSLTFSGASVSPEGNNPTASATAFGTGTSIAFTAGEVTGVPLVLFKTETAVIAATDGTVSATGADRLTVTVAAAAAAAAQSTLAVSPSSVAPGGTATATVTVRDAYGNVITGATSAAFATSTSGGSLGSFSCTSGVCTATYTAPILAGAKTLSATIGGTDIGSSPATVTVTAGAASRLVIIGTSTQTAGASQTITIRALDANGNIATGYTGAKSLTFSGANVSPEGNNPTASATAFGTGTSVTFTSGVATPVVMALYTAETAVIATTDGTISATGTDRLTVTVSADNASPVISDITASPASIVANGASESTLSVTLKDAYGNPTTTVASPGTVALVRTTGTGTLLGSLASIGGGVYTQQVQSDAAAGGGTFRAALNGTQTTKSATVTYVAAGGVLSRIVCTTSQPAGQSAAGSATVNLCSSAVAGDLELVTLALDGVDDLSAPAASPTNGTWVKIASELQTTGSGGNKPMLLILYARRYAAANDRVVTFTASTNHKWSVDMVTLQSSGVALPSAADVSVATNSSGSGLLISPTFTATEDNTVLYHVFANSATGATATISPGTDLTTLGTNNTGGTSSLSFLELVSNTVTAPARTFTSSVSANTVLLRLVVRP